MRISGISKMASVFILSIPIVSANTFDYMQYMRARTLRSIHLTILAKEQLRC